MASAGFQGINSDCYLVGENKRGQWFDKRKFAVQWTTYCKNVAGVISEGANKGLK